MRMIWVRSAIGWTKGVVGEHLRSNVSYWKTPKMHGGTWALRGKGPILLFDAISSFLQHCSEIESRLSRRALKWCIGYTGSCELFKWPPSVTPFIQFFWSSFMWLKNEGKPLQIQCNPPGTWLPVVLMQYINSTRCFLLEMCWSGHQHKFCFDNLLRYMIPKSYKFIF